MATNPVTFPDTTRNDPVHVLADIWAELAKIDQAQVAGCREPSNSKPNENPTENEVGAPYRESKQDVHRQQD
jgi:hypothetical protein